VLCELVSWGDFWGDVVATGPAIPLIGGGSGQDADLAVGSYGCRYEPTWRLTGEAAETRMFGEPQGSSDRRTTSPSSLVCALRVRQHVAAHG
jgi:hypothetical protein